MEEVDDPIIQISVTPNHLTKVYGCITAAAVEQHRHHPSTCVWIHIHGCDTKKDGYTAKVELADVMTQYTHSSRAR